MTSHSDSLGNPDSGGLTNFIVFPPQLCIKPIFSAFLNDLKNTANSKALNYVLGCQCQSWGVKIGWRLRRPPHNEKDVGSNPAATRKEKSDIGDPPTEGSPMVWTGSQWKTGDVKPN